MPGTFPALKTGAIAQYPFQRAGQLSVEEHTFFDFSRVAYRDTPVMKMQWTIALDALDAGEIARLRAFFEQQQGKAGVFSFTDPFDASVHSTCSFADDTFTQQQNGEMVNKTKLTVYEHV